MRVKALTILFFLLMIPLPLGLNRKKTRIHTVGALREALKKSKIISRYEIRRICRVYRTKLKKEKEVVRQD